MPFRTGNTRLSEDSLFIIEPLLLSLSLSLFLKNMVVSDNRTAAGALDSMNVHKICCKAHRPNIRHMPVDELTLLGNNSTDWSLGCQHRRLSNSLFDIYGNVNALPAGNAVLMEVASVVLRLMITITFPEFEAANTNNCVVIMKQRALLGISHWREVRPADFVQPSEEEFVRAYSFLACTLVII